MSGLNMHNVTRFKFEFMECESYEDIQSKLRFLQEWFSLVQELGVEYVPAGAMDDYHIFEIDDVDPDTMEQLDQIGGFQARLSLRANSQEWPEGWSGKGSGRHGG